MPRYIPCKHAVVPATVCRQLGGCGVRWDQRKAARPAGLQEAGWAATGGSSASPSQAGQLCRQQLIMSFLYACSGFVCFSFVSLWFGLFIWFGGEVFVVWVCFFPCCFQGILRTELGIQVTEGFRNFLRAAEKAKPAASRAPIAAASPSTGDDSDCR